MTKIMNFLKKIYSDFIVFWRPARWRGQNHKKHLFDILLLVVFWALFLLLFIMILLPAIDMIPKGNKTPVEEKKEVVVEYIPHPSEKLSQTDIVLRKGQNYSTALKKAKIPMQDILNSADALSILMDLTKLQIGQPIALFFAEDNSFQGVKISLKNGEIVSAFKNSNGIFIPENREGRIRIEHKEVEGKIASSLNQSAEEKGLSKNLIQQIVQALSDEIDFKKDVAEGDTYRIIYEKKTTETGVDLKEDQLLFVHFKNKGKDIIRYAFADAFGKLVYYNERGVKPAQQILSRPLGLKRISSYFGYRKHPILKYRIFHKGIDYPAPKDTPIPAGADGIIVKMGRNGAYGKYIKIRHNDQYSTAYAHLNDYNSRLRVGSPVKKGQIIGYVGSTGRSTGPHLHYEVHSHDKVVDPLKNYIINEVKLTGEKLSEFIISAKKINPNYVFPKENAKKK